MSFSSYYFGLSSSTVIPPFIVCILREVSYDSNVIYFPFFYGASSTHAPATVLVNVVVFDCRVFSPPHYAWFIPFFSGPTSDAGDSSSLTGHHPCDRDALLPFLKRQLQINSPFRLFWLYVEMRIAARFFSPFDAPATRSCQSLLVL